MDHLWSPWRYRYVSQAAPDSECVLCTKGAAPASEDRENHVLHRDHHCYVVLNLFPYTTGHLMVTPYDHIADLSALPAATLIEMTLLAQRCAAALQEVYHPSGMNLGMNLGQAAGAGIAGHLHLHLLPRWFADANFMTTIGETRVLPEDLATTFDRLRPFFQS